MTQATITMKHLTSGSGGEELVGRREDGTSSSSVGIPKRKGKKKKKIVWRRNDQKESLGALCKYSKALALRTQEGQMHVNCKHRGKLAEQEG